jgi:hypothetical protein
MGALVRFGHDDIITRGHHDFAWLPQMGANDQSLQHTPVRGGIEKSLDRPITPSFASPTRKAQHGHPASHRQQGLSNYGELTQSSGMETLV